MLNSGSFYMHRPVLQFFDPSDSHKEEKFTWFCQPELPHKLRQRVPESGHCCNV